MQLKKENVVYNTDDVVLINQLKIDGFEEFEYKEPEKNQKNRHPRVKRSPKIKRVSK